MSISAQQVKELRELTGAGMMECKSALQEAESDFEKAIVILRKKGLAAAARYSMSCRHGVKVKSSGSIANNSSPLIRTCPEPARHHSSMRL